MATDLVKEIMDDIRSPLYQNAIFLMGNTALVSGAGFLFWFLLARLMTDRQVGEAIVIVGVVSFLAAFSNLGFSVGLVRFLPKTRRDRGRMVNSCLTIATVVALLGALGLLLGVDFWFPDGGDVRNLGLLVPVFLLLAFLQVQAPIVDNTFVANRRAGFVLLRSGLFQGARLVLPLLLVTVLGVVGVLASLAFAHLLALSVAFAFILPRLLPGFRPAPAVDRPILNDILHYSLGNHVAEIFHVLPYPVILVLIPRLTGSVAAAGYFGIPWLIASLLFAVPLMASVSLFAEGSHAENSLRRDLKRTLRFIVPLLILGILFVWFLGDWILGLFGAAYAAEGLRLLQILAVSGIFVAVNGLFISVARVLDWVKAVIALWAYVALATIGLAYLLIPAQGLEGAGMAWLIANATAASAVLAAYVLKRGSIRDLVVPDSLQESEREPA